MESVLGRENVEKVMRGEDVDGLKELLKIKEF